jgi:2-polyprenyl-3-methyl-5-hydroxy-6-metoxy-1,4-benzoquinol methylase
MKIENWKKEGNVHIGMSTKPQNLPYHQVISKLAIKYSKDGEQILDIGCGRGQLASLISKSGKRKISIADAYEQCLEETKNVANIHQTFLIGEQEFNIDKKIKKDLYDVCIMSHILEHLPHPIEAIRKTLDLTKDNGVLILAVPNPVRPNILVSNVLKRHYVNRGHIYAWDMSHWKNFLENINGLDVIEYAHDFVQIPGCYKFPFLQNIGKSLSHIVPWWSFSNIAVVRKTK